MNDLYKWAARWGISGAALEDLGKTLHDGCRPHGDSYLPSEAAVLNHLRLQASRWGWRLWRNNVGAAHTDTGSYIRFGLANDSPAMSKRTKSSDLIGIRPILILTEHVGMTLGQFVTRECKRPGWKYKGTTREAAQLNFITLINTLGGDAKFTTGDLL